MSRNLRILSRGKHRVTLLFSKAYSAARDFVQPSGTVIAFAYGTTGEIVHLATTV